MSAQGHSACPRPLSQGRPRHQLRANHGSPVGSEAAAAHAAPDPHAVAGVAAGQRGCAAAPLSEPRCCRLLLGHAEGTKGWEKAASPGAPGCLAGSSGSGAEGRAGRCHLPSLLFWRLEHQEYNMHERGSESAWPALPQKRLPRSNKHPACSPAPPAAHQRRRAPGTGAKAG